MEFRIVEKEELKVVGISWNGTYSQAKIIPRLFDIMEKRLEEVPFQTKDPVLIAPFHSRESEFTYYVTTPVEEVKEVPEGMVGFSIPRKYYVRTTHLGGPEEVENTYLRLFNWMEEYGYEQDHQALSLEIFPKQQNAAGNLQFEIYLPIKMYKNN
ncbi:GyrI-like domain-containing protein [Neobacillus sp. OS1-32]|uniref:GyrI-like domain-containing protein n=1 Tax=Neobacillus paridis TaxID=2803862 RepID=A0ABS1TNR7_9BACI|nr:MULTISPECIES: GyrI-like domain-containing protein [Neobacillus]MBL4952887.1 GyrI-like domain-containing protein [Neobacillus paridis]WML31590.1 GyrI-like domain-containing protein [Neobacillus sp. OS1-32]